MNNETITNDNTNIVIKHFILDPLSVIVKLAILSNKPVGTKLLIHNNVIYFQEPGPFQSICRMFYNTNKIDLQYMYNPINLACINFLSKAFVDKTPRIKNLFICAQKGLKKLMDTYKSCSILNLTLNYYYVILSNHINQTYNENIFLKDAFTNYYSSQIVESFHKQWTEERIKVILDLISFLMKNTDNPSNVKSLETIMESIDNDTKGIIDSMY